MAIAVTYLGGIATKIGQATSITFSGGEASAGDWLIVASAGDQLTPTPRFDDDSESTTYEMNKDVEVDNVGEVACGLYSIKLPVDIAAGDRVLMTQADVGDARAFLVYKVTGIADTPLDKTANNTGSGANATVGPTATLSQADEICFAVTGVEDEVDDPHGSWTTGAAYISGNEQFEATNGGGDSGNIQVHAVAKIVSATTAQNGADNGHDSTDWAACIATYKAPAVGGWAGEFCGVAVAEFDGVTPAEIDGVS